MGRSLTQGSQKEPILPIAWFLTSGLLNCEIKFLLFYIINFMVTCYGPRKPIQVEWLMLKYEALKKRPSNFILIEILSISCGGGCTNPESVPLIPPLPPSSWILGSQWTTLLIRRGWVELFRSPIWNFFLRVEKWLSNTKLSPNNILASYFIPSLLPVLRACGPQVCWGSLKTINNVK